MSYIYFNIFIHIYIWFSKSLIVVLINKQIKSLTHLLYICMTIMFLTFCINCTLAQTISYRYSIT